MSRFTVLDTSDDEDEKDSSAAPCGEFKLKPAKLSGSLEARTDLEHRLGTATAFDLADALPDVRDLRGRSTATAPRWGDSSARHYPDEDGTGAEGKPRSSVSGMFSFRELDGAASAAAEQTEQPNTWDFGNLLQQADRKKRKVDKKAHEHLAERLEELHKRDVETRAVVELKQRMGGGGRGKRIKDRIARNHMEKIASRYSKNETKMEKRASRAARRRRMKHLY